MCRILRLAVLLTVSGYVAPGPAGAAGPAPPPIAFGTNIGHWLSQAKLDRGEMATFFTEADVRRIRSWGMDHIRLPVDAPLFASATDRDEFSEEGLSWIDRAVTWTRAHGLTLVLDMHHLPGHGFMTQDTNTIWQDGPDRRQALALWRTLAARYADQPHVVFELLNEPVAPEGQHDSWHGLARELVAAIRAVNRDNWIMVGSNRWSNVDTFRVLPKLDDPRIVYTFHLYDPFLFTHQRASWVMDDVKNLPGPVPYPGPLSAEVLHTPWLRGEYGWMAERPYGATFLRERLAPVLRFREQHNVPVYCGEFGVIDKAPAPDRLRWYRDVTRIFREEGIGFANWNYKSDNFGLVGRDGAVQADMVEAIGAAQGETRALPFDRSGDIGPVRQRGSVSVAGPNVYEVAGGGRNIWGTADEFYFASSELAGDLDLMAHVSFVEGGPGTPDPHRKAGLMIRATLDPDSPYVDAMVHGDGLVSLQYRAVEGGPTAEVKSGVRAPAALRLERHGDVFSLEVRQPNGGFHPAGAIVLSLPERVHVGLAVSAHAADRLERARFSGVRLAAHPVPPGARRVTESTLETIDVATGERRRVYRAREHFEAPNWSRDGLQFLINQGGLLYTIPTPLARPAPAGGRGPGSRPVRLDTGTVTGCNNDHGYSPDGSRIALSCGPRGESRVHVMPAAGGQPALITPETPSYWHGWSPDGATLAYVGRRSGEYDIYTIPAEGGPERRITTAKGLDDGPDYTADGAWIWFNSDRSGEMRLYRMRPDGSGQELMTRDPQYGDWFPHPSPDGRWIVFLSFDESVEGHPANKDVVLRLMPADGSAAPRVIARLFGGQGTINVPSWSPDSRQVAFVSYRLVLPED